MREPIVDMERVEALIAEMSLDQKIGQMVQAERNTISPDGDEIYQPLFPYGYGLSYSD